MQLRLHANATTTPRTRAYIQNSTASPAALARELGIHPRTVARWKNITVMVTAGTSLSSARGERRGRAAEKRRDRVHRQRCRRRTDGAGGIDPALRGRRARGG